ncbi:S8 family peptidase [Paenibacillus thermotolerans]|uniref:S8 family peptidase n=1 Tax=Paenibacillus thermotolerans TaxID=3027807 RepID=UPI002368F30D|nr:MULTISPECIES: S8 family serine peptidase [unclassified Paenibacillus]
MKNIWIAFGAAIAAFALLLGQGSAAAAQAAALPVNDPHYDKQKYLTQIHVPEAWEYLKGRQLKTVTVAIVDSGIDLNHPDLKDRLVEGKNILEPAKPPQDDHGHGTNVAGIIAAIRNNEKGIAGIAPNVNLMPVKAIGSDGKGDEEHLGEGIKYAIDHGADIIVLSLGLNLYSTYLYEIVNEAEQKGVLLIAATGNEGQTVKYPAAYPTVVGVGGASVTNEYKAMSNYGPEVDLIAPWYVYTTAVGGRYVYKEGTSMAAPQVAAVAALILGLEPDLKPYEVRNRLRQSAETSHKDGWNLYTGYGMLRADLALSMPPVEDMNEPNNSFGTAKALSVSNSISGAFQGKSDNDWFYLDPPYQGEIGFRLTDEEGKPIPAEAVYYGKNGGLPKKVLDLSTGKFVRLPVTTDRVYIDLRPQAGKAKAMEEVSPYRLETEFHIYKDPFEDNDKAYKAYLLPERSQTVRGTFHQVSDQDWFAMNFTTPGTLRLKVETDTPRIDPELYFASEGGSIAETIDEGSEEDPTEYSPAYQVKPGKYYVRVRNVKTPFPLPVTGEYTLTVDFEKKFIDGNEPNDRSFQATTMIGGTDYKGVFDSASDEDWFKFQLGGRSLVTVEITGIPKDRYMYYTLYNASVKQKFGKTSPFGTTKLQLSHDLGAGTYYIKLKTDAAYQDKQYNIRITSEPLYAGFRDIADHWARDSIVKLTEGKVVTGYANYRFQPDRKVTRAEAAVMIARAFKLKSSGKAEPFPDVSDNTWYADAIAGATAAKIVKGYPDGTFKPNEPVTRAEMAAMAAIAAGKKPTTTGTVVFTDMTSRHWAAGYVQVLVREKLVNGFDDGSFRPNVPATRAEFAALLDRLLK